jgi:phenylalanyl-tRNA synthetase beta subunit
MKISHNTLQKLIVETLPTPVEIEQKLFDHAFEVEEIETVGDDTIYDIAILPDRQSDAGSHYGMAREIAGLYGYSLKPVTAPEIPSSETISVPSVTIATDSCNRYCAVRIDGVKIAASPEWLSTLLESMGQRSINNVVDATNYVLSMTGQPTHAFDAGKITGGITVRNANDGETILLLSGEEKTLAAHNMVIADDSALLALAGVKGGKHAEVDNNTTNIILESAHFNYASVRKTARSLSILTDAAKRFENNISADGAYDALIMLAQMIIEIAGGTASTPVDHYSHPEERWNVSISKNRASQLIGVKLSPAEFTEVFEKFHVPYTYDNETEVLTVHPDTSMRYLRIPEDLVDEIVRYRGYKNLVGVIPQLAAIASDSGVEVASSIARSNLLAVGYWETFTYAFRESGDIKMNNALSDKSYLRTNIAQGFADSLEKNYRNADVIGLSEIKMFEIGNVFTNAGESTHVCVGIKRAKDKGVKAELEAIVAELATALGTELADITFTGETIVEATIPSEMSQTSVQSFVSDSSDMPVKFVPWSQYPAITRDIAVWVPESTDSQELVDMYTKLGTELLVRAPRLVDQFTKEGRTSYAFRLVFQAFDRTLTDDDIKPITDAIYASLDKVGYEVR